MKLLLAGDYRTDSTSGYAVILKHLAIELSKRGHQITVLGSGWDRGQHDYSFQIIPTDFTWMPVQVLRLSQAMNFDHVVLAMDVPKLRSLLDEVTKKGHVWPKTSGLFPIESGPVLASWAKGLDLLSNRFVISEFALDELQKVGLTGTHIPVTAVIPDDELRKDIARARLQGVLHLWGYREWLIDKDLVVLTIADNQERKDLPVIAQALTLLRDEEGINLVWLLMTPMTASYGYEFPALLEQTWMHDATVIFNGLTAEQMHWVYSAADVFALASQAEGACLPLYEAMAHKLPCVAPNCTAITEALHPDRGTLVEPSWTSIHPWGNVTRYHTDAESLAWCIKCAVEKGPNEAGYEFVKNRTWRDAAIRIEEAVNV